MLVNLSPTRRLPIAVIAATALAATSGVAYASGLPAAASDNASAVLQRLGITPGNSDHSAANPSHPANHGAVVSNLARTTTGGGARQGQGDLRHRFREWQRSRQCQLRRNGDLWF